MTFDNRIKSKFITLCEKSILTNKLDTLIKEELTKQCPIIEDIPEDTHNKLVTFIYCGDQSTYTANLYSPLLGGRGFPHKMTRLGNTNFFYSTLVVPDNIRVSYAFLPNDPTNYDEAYNNEQFIQKFINMWSTLIPDSYNLKKIILKTGKPKVQITNSILEMPFAPSQYWGQKKISVPNGQVTKFSKVSDILQSQRDYWIYLPPSYDKNIHYPLLIVFDGQLYYESGIPLPTIIDNLIYEQKIPPIIVLLIDSIGFYERAIDLRCSEIFLEFITHELLPEISSKYTISNDRLDKILMGASLGGLFSLYTSLKCPDLFGKVLSQSDGDNIISELIQSDQTYPLKIYLDIGSLENGAINQGTRDLLLSVGHEVIYHVFPGFHDLICWETAIPNALIQLLKEDPRIQK